MISKAEILNVLQTGEIDVEGLMPWSSNYTFLIRVCTPQFEIPAVYKPRRGERPLWDFPTGTLCNRERAAFLVSDTLKWDLIPPTVLRNGPNGVGSVQLFVEQHDPERHYFTIEGSPQFRDSLQKLTLFDIIINNADRKAGHVLVEEIHGDNPDNERVWGIDHGICFHSQFKLRSVIWEFAGQPIPKQLMSDLTEFQNKLTTNSENFRQTLSELINNEELVAVQKRLSHLINDGTFRQPGPGRHYPWPPV